VFKRDRFNHKSPNSAQTESVCAGALGLRLAGDACYFGKLVKKPFIGDELRAIEPRDIPRACRLVSASEFFAMALCLAVLVAVYFAL
ncbi:MAG: cobalamin biosynthesis protein, partial [Thermoguttaceae bacterium]|nr:cobalamin biosynthesis protein [Thermoguttaceae bacterium]